MNNSHRCEQMPAKGVAVFNEHDCPTRKDGQWRLTIGREDTEQDLEIPTFAELVSNSTNPTQPQNPPTSQ